MLQEKSLAVILQRPRQVVTLWMLVTATVASCLGLGALCYVAMARMSGASQGEAAFGPIRGAFTVSNPVGARGGIVLTTANGGWQDSGFDLRVGETMSVIARGFVTVDGAGQVAAGLLRRDIESRLQIPPDQSLLPEDRFSDKEIAAIEHMALPWVDANGMNPSTALSQRRRGRRVLPGAALGALIGQIRYGSDQRQVTMPFFIGERLEEMTITQGGRLLLNVNDVVFPSKPNLFYMDNAGVFMVTVEVR